MTHTHTHARRTATDDRARLRPEHAEPQTVHSPFTPDHDHDHDDADLPLEDNPIWQQDNVTLHSVGMDIGSLRHAGRLLPAAPAPHRRGADQPLHRRPPRHRLPLPGGADPLREQRGASTPRRSARSSTAPTARPRDRPGGRSTPAWSSSPARRCAARNAEAIAGVLAERGGELVTATAGHNMEAMLAAYGSGAAQVSYDRGCRILNVDIGGGTTKLALLDRGRVLATAAVHVGGRLQVVDDDGPHRPARPGRARARRRGPASTGRSATPPRPTRSRHVAERMADALVAALTADPLPDDVERAVPDRPARPAGRRRRRDVLRRRRRVRLRPRGARRSATSAPRSAGRCAGGSTTARCPSRCCRRASASAPPRWGRRSTACSCRATPAGSPTPTPCSPAATCRSSSRSTSSATRSSADAVADAIRRHLVALDADALRRRRRAGAVLDGAARATGGCTPFACGVRDGLADRIAARPARST